VVKSVTIAGDVTGTWAVDNTVGIKIAFCLLAGAGRGQTPGSWVGSNAFGSTNQFNFAATNGNVFELFDVGLYEGSAAPAFQLPDFVSELALCLRHYEKMGTVAGPNYGGVVNAAGFGAAQWKVLMRAAPTVTWLPNAGTASATQSSTHGGYANFSTGPNGYGWIANARL
jgi:hypothetical protein